jgi:hypothetical protein
MILWIWRQEAELAGSPALSTNEAARQKPGDCEVCGSEKNEKRKERKVEL